MKVFGSKRAIEQELAALENEAQTICEKLTQSDKGGVTYAVYLALRICLLLLKERKERR